MTTLKNKKQSDINDTQTDILTAVILTAGKGTRVLPLSAAIPKALLPLGDKPAVQRVAEEALLSGCKKLIFVTDNTLLVEKHFAYAKTQSNLFADTKLQFVLQPKPLGSGHALLTAKPYVDNAPFFVLNCDDLFSQNACNILKNQFCGFSLLGTKLFWGKKAKLLGVAKCKNNKLLQIMEKPKDISPTALVPALVGRYIFLPYIFDILQNTTPVNKEIRLTDAINTAALDNDIFLANLSCRRFDTGGLKSYARAFKYFAKN